MTKASKFFLVTLRVALGWLMLHSAYGLIMTPGWSAAGYLSRAKFLKGFFGALLDPSILPVVSFMNKWGFFLLGISLIFGIGVRLSSVLGAILMILYYLPILEFPYWSSGTFLALIPFPSPRVAVVDDHLIYGIILAFFAALPAGRIWGLDTWCGNLPLCKRYPLLKRLWG